MTTRMVWDNTAIKSIADDIDSLTELRRVGKILARRAAGHAPHDTGAGAASIDVFDDPRVVGQVDISWDDAHWYMRFQELGTKFVPAQHFLLRALHEMEED